MHQGEYRHALSSLDRSRAGLRLVPFCRGRVLGLCAHALVSQNCHTTVTARCEPRLDGAQRTNSTGFRVSRFRALR